MVVPGARGVLLKADVFSILTLTVHLKLYRNVVTWGLRSGKDLMYGVFWGFLCPFQALQLIY